MAAARTGAVAEAVGAAAEAAAETAINATVMEELAALGAEGAHENNYERDLHRWVRKQRWARVLPSMYDFKITVSCPGGRDCR